MEYTRSFIGGLTVSFLVHSHSSRAPFPKVCRMELYTRVSPAVSTSPLQVVVSNRLLQPAVYLMSKWDSASRDADGLVLLWMAPRCASLPVCQVPT
ncbi:hypothetical protein CBR_g12494 [Chara braunii]|uniref:Uncharacterized protein n=1 Tax=Chara braunii TaxID=69332 RepID=A0A388JSH8_CHABU|nr:hypothetical protein CBR_g12494 [Chara braunii]|eukprot:GBG60756.1 hypothetical protein CBR_g12494 [Chara braunii]